MTTEVPLTRIPAMHEQIQRVIKNATDTVETLTHIKNPTAENKQELRRAINRVKMLKVEVEQGLSIVVKQIVLLEELYRLC